MRPRHLIVALAACALIVAGCSGSTDDKPDPDRLQARLATAKKAIDAAQSLTISLTTPKLPSGVSGLLSAKGRANHSPAFKGTVTVVTGSSSVKADVVAVDGKVYAKTSFAPVFLTIDPASLKAPDPASLLDPESGISQILVRTERLRDGGRSRDGSDVLTTIKGDLAGDIVRGIIPSAAADETFAVTYRLDDDDKLRDASLTGAFYPGGGDVTYSVTLTTSDATVSIEAPARFGR